MYPLGPWPLKIWMFALLVTRDTADHGKGPETKAGHAFPRQRHVRRRGGLFISARVFFPV
jgi:hypothetical protein